MSIDPTRGTDRPVVGSYPTYEQAQRAVDHLADNKFPVEHTAIIGTDLRMVETVIARLSWGRVIGAGAATGAWFGLLVGLLLSLFVTSKQGAIGLLGFAIVWGAVFGVIFASSGYAMTRGRRDFTSRSKIVAARYDVVADLSVADDAKNLLIKLAWRS